MKDLALFFSLICALLLFAAGCDDAKEESQETTDTTQDTDTLEVSTDPDGEDGEDTPDEVEEMCFVDFPCFAEGPSCQLMLPGVINVFTSYGCEEVCGDTPCSGGGCSLSTEACPQDHVCAASDDAAACVPTEEACGGTEHRQCPSGQICAHGSFHTSGGVMESPSCTNFDSDVYGRCIEAPDCDFNEGEPVCGCDGVFYANECQRQRAGIPAADDGRCEGEPIDAGACFKDLDCVENGAFCSHTNPDNQCGMCEEMPSCESDDDCAATPDTPLCDVRPLCLCSGGATCLAACTSDTDCPRDEVCSTSGHCELRSCVEEECPSAFYCEGESSLCWRRTCETSADCLEGDFCVTGYCESEPGICTFAVP